MHIIALRTLRDFWVKHPMAEKPLRDWHAALSKMHAANFSALKAAFNSADWVAGHVVFDVGGNKFRVVADVVFRSRTVFIKHVFTHKEYDQWNP